MRRLTAIFVFIALICTGCMDELHNYDECVRLETARCKVRAECDSGFDYGTCVAYYREFCRTRQIKGPDSDLATGDNMDACVDAILALSEDCETFDSTVDETEFLSECFFLWPASEDDAGADAS